MGTGALLAESASAEFTPTKADLVAFNMFTLGRSHSYRAKALRLFALLTLIGMVAAVSSGGTRVVRDPGFIAFFIVIVAGTTGLLLIARPVLVRITVARALAASDQGSLLGPTHVELTVEGVRWKSEAADSLTRWTSIIDIAADTNSIYLYFTSMCAVMVPRRAFLDAAGFLRFDQTARSLWQRFGGK
jgi:hypothetical protein